MFPGEGRGLVAMSSVARGIQSAYRCWAPAFAGNCVSASLRPEIRIDIGRAGGSIVERGIGGLFKQIWVARLDRYVAGASGFVFGYTVRVGHDRLL